MLSEHDVVTVTEDIPQEGIHAGDVGAIVHHYAQRDCYEVELLDSRGRSKGVKSLDGSKLLRLNITSLVA